MKIVIAEKISSAAIAVFKQEAGWNVVTPDQITGAVTDHLSDADALVVRSAVKVTAALLEQAPKLRVIGRAGVGVDNVDADASTRKGIVVMNTPGGNAVAVAEHTILLMLSMARSISKADTTTRGGKWEKKSLQGVELRNKTLGIIGLGRIGLEVAKRAKSFEMKVVAYDPFVSPAVARDHGIELAELDGVYTAADYLSLHVGLTPQTNGMINADSIKKMKKGVRLVNCARGELIDEAALAEALKSGHVAGAALDVFRVEPPKESALLGIETVVATPHIAGSTNEAQDAVGVQIALQVKEYLKNGVIQNAVNIPSLTHEEYELVHPYITLSEKLGAFLAQISDGNLEEISITYSGRIADAKTELIRNSAIKGVLSGHGADAVNLVNAAALAKQRGIQVVEKSNAGATPAAGSVITVSLKTNQGTNTAKGGVLHGHSSRLLHLDGIDVEAPLAHNLIYFRNRDVPGVIGRIGTVLGESGVNIANFSLGRLEATNGAKADSGGNAIAVVQVDQAVPSALLEKLRKLEAVVTAKSATLS